MTKIAKDTITPMPSKVLIHNMKNGTRVVSGILIPDDDGKLSGVRPRWAQIWRMGDEAKKTEEYNEGEWALIEHGRWSRGIRVYDNNGKEEYIWEVDRNGIMIVTDEEPTDDAFGTKV